MIDLTIVGVFLLITLVIGIWHGRGIKDLTTFSIAERNYTTAVLVATVTATYLGGESALGSAEETFKYGIFFMIAYCGDVAYSLIIALVVAPRIDKYRNCISIGDMIEKSYGKTAKIITGITGTLKCITTLGGQVSAIGYVSHYFLGLTHLHGILIGIGIIIIYSASGGVKAVTITDVIQFVVLMITIPMICNLGLAKVGGYTNLFNALPTSHAGISALSNKDLIRNVDIFLIMCLSFVGPTTAPRLLMAKNSQQAVVTFYYSALIYGIFFTLISLIGLSAKILKPDLNAVLALPYIIDLLPHGLRGLAIAGLVAIVMSTADSVVNTASVLIVNDIIVPLSKRVISEERKLKIARLSTILVGTFSIIAAVSWKSILDILIISCSFWTPIVVVPFLFALLGFRVEKKSFLISAIGGSLVLIIWKILKVQTYVYFSAAIPGMIGNAIFFFASHYYYKNLRPSKFTPVPILT
jgi:SSS family solute:Na+ symporter